MTPGPTHVIRCPLCSQLGKYPTIASGNTFGAVYYTDGKRIAPMLPATPSVVRCGFCHGTFWREAAAEVGQFMEQREEPAEVDESWLKAGYLDEPDEGEYLAALERLISSTPAEERSIRLFAWWRGNDRHRGPLTAPATDNPELTNRRHDNMRALLPLLATAEWADLILRAEVLRQLGEFELATKELTRHFPAAFDAAISRLLYLCAQRDSTLQKL
jgi:hypothetical protein